MIYFLQCGGMDGPIKIGWVKSLLSLDRRVRNHQIGCPYPLRVVGTIGDASLSDEHDLHQQFKATHLQGEWFYCSHSLLAFIRENCLGGGAFKHLACGIALDVA